MKGDRSFGDLSKLDLRRGKPPVISLLHNSPPELQDPKPKPTALNHSDLSGMEGCTSGAFGSSRACSQLIYSKTDLTMVITMTTCYCHCCRLRLLQLRLRLRLVLLKPYYYGIYTGLLGSEVSYCNHTGTTGDIMFKLVTFWRF